MPDSQYMIIANRIPREYFITQGSGQSDIAIHSGSYHLALYDAGIEMCNIMTYSSILPAIACEVKQPEKFVHGSVMESIMAVAHTQKNEQATAGIIYGWLYNKKNNQKHGGLVCEHAGNMDKKAIEKNLRLSLIELYENGYNQDFDLKNIHLVSESIVPAKKFGTALVALCFVNYQIPVLNRQ